MLLQCLFIIINHRVFCFPPPHPRHYLTRLSWGRCISWSYRFLNHPWSRGTIHPTSMYPLAPPPLDPHHF
ncbi:hypothetical protein B0F90DRAFT_1769499, partial [Multifurca ochricompacta]